jgi:hypothetical protein
MGATATIALSAYQTVSSFQTQQRQATAASAQGNYAKSVEQRNAELARLESTDALERGQIAEQRERLATRQRIGTSRAALAAQGIDVSMGSAADVQATEAAIGELDALTIRNNAAREAWGYQVEAEFATTRGNMAAFAGNQEAAGYRAESLNTLLTGAANTYGLYQRRSNSKKKAP